MRIAAQVDEKEYRIYFRKLEGKRPLDRPCGLVVRVPGYRSRVPGSIPGDPRFSEKWV
jgi:hypothetical protein